MNKFSDSFKQFWGKVTGKDVSEFSEAELADDVAANGDTIVSAMQAHKEQSKQIADLKEGSSTMEDFKTTMQSTIDNMQASFDILAKSLADYQEKMNLNATKVDGQIKDIATAQAEIIGTEKPTEEANAAGTIEALETNVVKQIEVNGGDYDAKKVADQAKGLKQ